MRKRILVVDDDPDISLMLTDRLTQMGFHVVTAENGWEGMKKFEEVPVDGILLDLNMPVMDGMTMLNEVRQRASELPVIVMSAEEHEKRLIWALLGGATDYLLKPIDFTLLTKKWVKAFPNVESEPPGSEPPLPHAASH